MYFGNKYWGKSEPITQNWDQRQVCRGHWVVAQVFRADPRKALTFLAARDSLPFSAGKQRHEQVKIRVGVAGEGEGCKARGPSVDAQLFLQLSDQGCLGGLARFDLATRKFPQPCEGFAGGALSEENAAIGVNKGYCGDEDDFHKVRPFAPVVL